MTESHNENPSAIPASSLSSDETRLLFEQLACLFEQSGIAVGEEEMLLMQPLLSGELTAGEHRALLEEQIRLLSENL